MTKASMVSTAWRSKLTHQLALQSSSNRCGLWLINLRDFSDLEDFQKDPPIPVRRDC